MGFRINITNKTGTPATYGKLASYTAECSDKQYIYAIFQLYASKECRDNGYIPFSDVIELKFELDKDFTGNIIKTIYEQAKELKIFSGAEVI